MKKASTALTALFVLFANWSATASVIPPVKGSTVLVPPLFSKQPLGEARAKTVVIRLPAQAGKVSKMVTTNLVSKSESWIAKGDKYYSLCMPNRHMVACAPIVATSIMQDIEVGAVAGDKGVPLLTFRINPATKLTPMRLATSMKYFLARTHKQVAHFNRMVMNYAPMKGATLLKAGIAKTLIASGSGGGCSYDDWGSYDCTGGDSGWDGGGYDTDTYDWNSDYSDDSSWEDPSAGTPTLPTFPSGNDNGDSDPCIDGSGNNICQQVVITGERPAAPDPMADQPCIVTPWVRVCRGTPSPPVMVDPMEQLPRGPSPMFPQSACNFSRLFCSAGQIPEEKPPPLTDEEKLQAAKDACYKRVDAEMAYCRSAVAKMYPDPNNNCMRNAVEHLIVCDKMGKDGY